jgi:16S rRNA (cytidine1402-2'-O)-methyltransferase
MLYIVATPIGNLQDITERALQILRKADVVLAEDTRHTRKLLTAFHLSKPLERLDEHTTQSKTSKILLWLKEGKNIALVTDAGTPGISDPGAKLVSAIYDEFEEGKIVPIPGSSAVSLALSASGCAANKYLFLGYPPKKKRRKLFFKEVADCKCTCVFFSTPHGILKDLAALKDAGADKCIFVAREMTKRFETLYRGDLDEVNEKIKNDPQK